jgi:DNA-directed RNA polymerase specialized sigma24 family protein
VFRILVDLYLPHLRSGKEFRKGKIGPEHQKEIGMVDRSISAAITQQTRQSLQRRDCRAPAIAYLATRSRRVPSILRPARFSEFNDWMKFLDSQERETMTLRFVEEWEYHEIAAAQAVPIGTVQWRVFNSKKKLAAYLIPVQVLGKKAA